MDQDIKKILQAELKTWKDQKMNNELTIKQLKELEVAGFIGTDVNLEISLFEHNQIAAISEREILVLYAKQFDGYYKFDFTRVDIEELIEDLKEVEEGFYNFIGITRIRNLSSIHTGNIYAINRAIFDINMYQGIYRENCIWNYTNFNALIENLF